ncbi:hypothetical protein SNOG_01717 [Parastagonospora nodorum SN15]|uniref:Uncharacterized protein n=1 Tax=Phaeosphaeria nodorum (strain SN15 / ATCC MYA-4574 / FGSC 10173) TaxID=321614 RepID=Q0V2P7_PHANO|nr:hypothetical protein SNOG_01717 [Parastagonospora nodorum SN15]EAT91366.1 hypothetical protein SNOG_01717 [Parastagonospora nodorum SN15]
MLSKLRKATRAAGSKLDIRPKPVAKMEGLLALPGEIRNLLYSAIMDGDRQEPLIVAHRNPGMIIEFRDSKFETLYAPEIERHKEHVYIAIHIKAKFNEHWMETRGCFSSRYMQSEADWMSKIGPQFEGMGGVSAEILLKVVRTCHYKRSAGTGRGSEYGPAFRLARDMAFTNTLRGPDRKATPPTRAH